jgi:hypothetical protein
LIFQGSFSFSESKNSKQSATRRTAFLYIFSKKSNKKGNQYEKQIQKADKLAFGKHYDVGSTSYSDISG